VKNYAIIPARAGSKSIINKNLQKINGKSLVDKTIESALAVKFFNRIMLTTDIEDLHEQYKMSLKIEVLRRPDNLCTDEALMGHVLENLIARLNLERDSFVWLLQPTSPFRLDRHFYDIKAKLGDQYSSIISVSDVEASHPNRMYTIKGNNLYPLRHNNFDNKQELKKIFIRNGCFYVFNVGEFLKNEAFYLKPCYGYQMDGGVNIDSPKDLLLAKAIIKQGAYKW